MTEYITNRPLKEGMARVYAKISEDEHLTNLANTLLHTLYACDDKERFLEMVKENQEYIESKLGKDSECYIAVVFDMGWDKLLDIYKKRGISEEILKDTFSDLDVRGRNYHVLSNGVGGIDNYPWLLWHMKGQLFQIGRLQFIVTRGFWYNACVFSNKAGEVIAVATGDLKVNKEGLVVDNTDDASFTTVFEETEESITANIINEIGSILDERITFSKAEYTCVLKKGDDVLDIHVPIGGKMDYDECVKNINDAVDFGRKHFPERDFKAITLFSWLLSEELKEGLDCNSNIVKFSNLFTRVSCHLGTHHLIYKWLFGFDTNKEDYREHTPVTSLQRLAHKLISEDRWFLNRAGFILIKK